VEPVVIQQDTVMFFGKYKGTAMCNVPLDYLLWCYHQLPKLPFSIIEELDRRHVPYGGRTLKPPKKSKSLGSFPPIVGCSYPTLLYRFIVAGGNIHACPFDAAGYSAQEGMFPCDQQSEISLTPSQSSGPSVQPAMPDPHGEECTSTTSLVEPVVSTTGGIS
jgi:hypothetical protein